MSIYVFLKSRFAKKSIYTPDVEFILGFLGNITSIKTHFSSTSKINRFKMLVNEINVSNEIFDLSEIIC